jgi:hypothetical protein
MTPRLDAREDMMLVRSGVDGAGRGGYAAVTVTY